MPGQAIVTIDTRQWSVAVANTLAEIISGLSGVESITPQTGMLFDLGYDQKYIQIDMSRMLFPLDIIFINSTQGVVGVMENVQPTYTDVRFEASESYPGARLFLEINADEAVGIEDGDSVAFQGLTAQNSDLDITGLMNSMVIFMVIFMMMRMMDKALSPERPKLPPVKPPPGYRPLGRSTAAAPPAVSTEEERLRERKESLENKGREMAREAGVEFLSLEPGSEAKHATPRYWFKDARGNNIIARDIEELKEKLGLLAHHHSPRRYGKPKSEEERAREHEQRFGARELPARGSGHYSETPPTRDDVTVHAWQERDRLSIWVEDKRTGETIAEWWDDEAREMFEDGFFKPGVPQYSWEKPGREFVDSVLDYLEETGGIVGRHSSGKSEHHSSPGGKVRFIGSCKVVEGLCQTHGYPVSKTVKCPESPLTDEEWTAAWELAETAYPGGQHNPWVNGWWPKTLEEAEKVALAYEQKMRDALYKFRVMQTKAIENYERAADKAIYNYRRYVMAEYERGEKLASV